MPSKALDPESEPILQRVVNLQWLTNIHDTHDRAEQSHSAQGIDVFHITLSFYNVIQCILRLFIVISLKFM